MSCSPRRTIVAGGSASSRPLRVRLRELRVATMLLPAPLPAAPPRLLGFQRSLRRFTHQV
jgi:hypothetical protein